MRQRSVYCGVMVWICMASAPTMSAPNENASPGRFGLEADIEATHNPTALDFSTDAWYRYVYHHEDAPLWDGLYVQAGGQANINAAYGQLGVYLEWLPIAVLQLHAQIDRYFFFGQNGALLSFADKHAAFGDRELNARRGQEATDQANRLLLQPTLQATLGRYTVSNETRYAFYTFASPGSYFWELEYDTLLKKNDRLVANKTSLLRTFTPASQAGTLTLGPYYEIVHAFGAALERRRLGITLSFEPTANHHRRQPHFYFQTGINLRDRNRDGQFYFAGGVGVSFE